MNKKAMSAMSFEEIAAFLETLDAGNANEAKDFLDGYRSADSPHDFLEQELFESAVNSGVDLQTVSYTFDIDANSYLAEICPDGVSGHVSLFRFCDLFFVRYEQYGEGAEDFGPFSSLGHAEEAFQEVLAANEPG